MNKYQEAYNRLAFNFGLEALDGTEYDNELNDFILFKELVDRATPKKPLLRKDGYDDESEICNIWNCSNCSKTFVIEDDTNKCNYCPNCGQRIDWSKDETD